MQVIKTYFIEAIKNISAFLKGTNISLNGKREKKIRTYRENLAPTYKVNFCLNTEKHHF